MLNKEGFDVFSSAIYTFSLSQATPMHSLLDDIPLGYLPLISFKSDCFWKGKFHLAKYYFLKLYYLDNALILQKP